jgi:hypothetical protein
MSVPLRRTSLRRLQVVLLGLALMGLALAPRASAAAPLDTVTVTGSTGDGFFSSINISAQSGTSGQNPGGTASFIVGHVLNVSGPVTCLSVTGPDQGGGTATAPTTGIVKFQSNGFGVVEVTVVDKGGNGADTFQATPFFGSATDCSTPLTVPDQLTSGRAVVFDATPLPTSKGQCKNGGWRNFPQFKNQGDCVSFVNTGK